MPAGLQWNVCVCMCVFSLSLSLAGCLSSAGKKSQVMKRSVDGVRYTGKSSSGRLFHMVQKCARVSINLHQRSSARDVEQSHKSHTSLILIQSPEYLLLDSANLQAWAAQAQATALQHSTFQLLQGLHPRGLISETQRPFQLILVVLVVLLVCANIFCVASAQCLFCMSRIGREESVLPIFQNLNLS